MDAVTYPHPEVRAELEAWGLLTLDVAEEPDLARAVGIDAIPTTLVVGPDGTVLDRVVGFLEPLAYRDRLRAARSTP